MDYDFDGIDKKLFKDMSRHFRNQERDEKRERMLNREIDPADKQFFEMYQGREVWVKSFRQPVIKGTVRMAFEKDAYVVETENGVLTMNMLRPGLKIGSDKPLIFDIMKPNHNSVFLTEKDMELSSIDFIIGFTKRQGISIYELLKDIEEKMDKYPEEFL